MSLFGASLPCWFILLLSVSAESWWWSSNTSSHTGSISDVAMMDCRRDAVVLLQVQLGHGIVVIDGSLGQVTHRCGVDHVSNHVLLDGLVLWDAGGRVFAANKSNMSAAFLVPPVISSFFGHFNVKSEF
jgi:hypothetical protein